MLELWRQWRRDWEELVRRVELLALLRDLEVVVGQVAKVRVARDFMQRVDDADLADLPDLDALGRVVPDDDRQELARAAALLVLVGGFSAS